MSDNTLKEIITVGDLIEYLKTFPLAAVVLKSDLGVNGYNRFRITEEIPSFPVMVNVDTSLDVDFVDAVNIDPPLMWAIVL